MNYKKSYNISDELLEKIISVAYGNASILETYQVKRLIRGDENLKKIFDDYRNTAKMVHSIKIKKFEKELNFVVDSNNPKKKRKSLLDEIYSLFLGKPFVYSAAVSVLIISIIFSIFSNRELTFNGYTTAEVEQANRESKQAIMIVANLFTKTGKTLKTDILYKEVSKPINEGINTVNNLFKKEKEK